MERNYLQKLPPVENALSASTLVDGTFRNAFDPNTRAWILDHLGPSLPVLIDDVFSSVFLEFTVHWSRWSPSNLAWPQRGQVSSAATSSQWRYTPKKCLVVKQKYPKASDLSMCFGMSPTATRVSHGFPSLLGFGVTKELWFQQDGATCHTARATFILLKDTFGDRLISRFGPVNWPPRSCDLTPLDYFLWGYVKSLVYADTPQTLYHLEDNIRRVIADIRPQMLENHRKLDVQIGLHPRQPWQSYARNHI
ncbi:uncharacterized protein TNCV_5083081 [Trichonephila clavipes]|nr:uncharacterized protein TNCV_5083081 [Trichonephila clavipes]